MTHQLRWLWLIFVIPQLACAQVALAQGPTKAEVARLAVEAKQLESALNAVVSKNDDVNARHVADVRVFAKGVEWCVRHAEFHKPRNGKGKTAWVKYCDAAIKTGNERLQLLSTGKSPWKTTTGSTIRGYVSRVDGSVQPYAISLPSNFSKAESGYRWPLHVKLHGRGGTRNEVRFFAEHGGKAAGKDQTWIQLDVFGRTDNAYRWSGETDVFEALADVKRRYRIDDYRITLWGFSMGGAGAWHLGLHHPSMWSSVGPGAGFVDFYNYQKQSEKRPAFQHKALRIYDSIDYVMNLFDVPFCTYGGELDAQLVASTAMVDKAKKLDVPVKLLIGKGMGHRFHPDSFKEFMAFHQAKAKKGRPRYPGAKAIRFITYTLKYNRCEWLTIEELEKQYTPTTVEAVVNPKDGQLHVRTKNVAAFRIARDLSSNAIINGKRLPLSSAADQLLPDVYYKKSDDGWDVLDYETSRLFDGNGSLHKRHNLQGPIDDAFMEKFICVKGTGKPLSNANHNWAMWTLGRFEGEFDKWLRGKVPVVNDSDFDRELLKNSNLVLFGDPGSNKLIAEIVRKLPIEWTEKGITVNGQTFDANTHGLSMIYPNPLNPRKYVVINSGHTMHEKDFKASNSWLFPRLGDIAIQKFEKSKTGGYTESIEWAELFDGEWKIPEVPGV
jgi:dienelactone hydrolase